MQISLNWLSELIDISNLKTDDIAKHLTDIGLEVEGQQATAPFPATVVVGRILEAVRHPNADSLQCCKVDVGGNAPLPIVCGAPNARVGLTVACAMVGTELGGGFKIKASKIRGEVSEGMLCSGKELGISEDSDGIIELPESYLLGQSVAKLMGISDHVFTLNVTPNRADCLGHLGVARDLAARLKIPLRRPKIHKPTGQGSSKDHIRVDIQDKDGCDRFVVLYMKDVSPVASPTWLQRRLEACGMRPINLVVDATNYVMLEYSQPIHAYDERFLKGDTLSVRAATAGETITTLDEQKRQLEAGDLLICDGEKPVGIAGVMGGHNSEVKADTRGIVIEVASFDPVRIRKTSKRLGLHSEASHRFERGIDTGALDEVAYRVAEVITRCTEELRKENASLPTPQTAAPAVDLVLRPTPSNKIAMRVSRCRKLLGMSLLTADEMSQRLTALGFELVDKAEDRLLFDIPSWRNDVTREVDLIEEVGRIVGFDKVIYDMPKMNISTLKEDPFLAFSEKARLTFASLGCTEVITFPFIPDKDLKALRIAAPHPYASVVELRNPLADEQKFLRTSLVPGILSAVLRNRNQLDHGSKLFECGRGYYDFKGQENAPGTLFKDISRHGRHLTERAREEKRTGERHLVAFVLDQPMVEKSWDSQERQTSFYSGKQLVTEFLRRFGVQSMQLQPLEADEVPFLHPKMGARLVLGSSAIGYVGELHPETVDELKLDLNAPPVVAELDLEKVFGFLKNVKITATAPTAFPPVKRDIAFVVAKTVTHETIQRTMKKFPKKKLLKDVSLFDIYEGEHVPAGHRSMAYGLVFQAPDKTLTDQEVEGELTGLLGWLKEQVGAVQRA